MAAQQDGIVFEEIRTLVEHMSRNVHRANNADRFAQAVQKKCLDLFSKDYKFSIIDNRNGELCNQYPIQMVLLESEKTPESKLAEGNVQSIYNLPKVKELFAKSRFARVRSRFAIPVIMYEGKIHTVITSVAPPSACKQTLEPLSDRCHVMAHILRSSTIAGSAEMCIRSGVDFLTSGYGLPGEDEASPLSGNDQQLYDSAQGQDIRLLKELNVSHICDLMVEMKKVKFGMYVTSSEKVDKESTYSDFTILGLPYPGCEFFHDWREKDYLAEDIHFDWSQWFVDACIDIPESQLFNHLPVDWTDYKKWDLSKLTQNYLRLIMQYVKDGGAGLLVHCISGWDRTPLFISLLRLSLWADGAIHTSLDATEILYLTIGYDWFLFGHNLPDRLSKGEEIFFFCFFFLKYITGEEYSIHRAVDSQKTQVQLPKPPSRHGSDCAMTDGLLLFDNDYDTKHSCPETSTPPLIDLSEGEQNGDSLTPPTNSSEFTKDFDVLHRRGNHFDQHSCSSPVTVPATRCRIDSSSSGSDSSWQLVTDTGSLPTSVGMRPRTTSSGSDTSPFILQVKLRQERLEKVRRMFYRAYSVTIGFHMTPSSTRGLSTLLEHVGEKVGIIPGKNSMF